MHMADALLSPAVGTTLWAGTAAVGGYASKKLKEQIDDRMIPLMGVLGAFIFAAQMINFTIPGTGSSGHLGGGMILAIILGPHAAFLVMASVLTVQALFFADGGLACPRLQYLEPGVLSLLPRLSLHLQTIDRRQSKARAHPCRIHRERRCGPAARRLFRRHGDASVRQERTALRRLPPADATDPPGHRHHRGFCDGRDHQLCAQRQTRDPRKHGRIPTPWAQRFR